MRIDRVASVNARIGWKALTAQEYQSDGYAFLATPNIKGSEIDFDNVNYISRFRYEESPELKLAVGDVLLAKDGNTLGIVNVVRRLPRPATVNGSIAVLRPFNIDPRFLRYTLESRVVQGHIEVFKNGMGVPHLFQRDIKRLPVLLPSAREQRRIADFLDTETARIDAICAMREQQDSLVEEAAAARAFDAIRGHNITGERKESRLQWLGSVPSRWRIAAVSHIFEVELGKMLNQERTTGDYLRPYLRVANVQWDKIDTEDLLSMDFPPQEWRRYRLREGDLLVCEGGSWPGRAAIWDGRIQEMYYQKALHRIRPRGGDLTRWLYYCLLAAEKMRVFAVQGNNATITHLTREQLRPQRFPFPDVSTQRSIVEELDRAAERDSAIKQLLQKQRRVLAEQRLALITAAITGQFDVSSASGRGVTDGVAL